MKIQSLSIVVPNKQCINQCKFCVSRMNKEDYNNNLNQNLPFYDLYYDDYIKRLEFARDNGCNTIMLTGNSEPQQNREFLKTFGIMNRSLSKPFRKIEMQTTGVLLDESYLRFLRNHVGVNTISLSVSSYDIWENADICKFPKNIPVDIKELSHLIKKYDFNLRLSLNLTKAFKDYSTVDYFDYAKFLKADQITFRVLYTSSNKDTEQDNWILKNALSESEILQIVNYVETVGTPLEILPFGQTKYSVNGIGTVVDGDCMSTELKDSYKYLILRSDCKLYSKWNDKGSLIF